MDPIRCIQEGRGLFDCFTAWAMTAPASPEAVAASLYWIIALPLGGAAICGVFGRWLGRANVNWIACGSVFGSFLLSFIVAWTVNDYDTAKLSVHSQDLVRYALGQDYGTWFSAGGFQVRFGLWVDHLSSTMLLVICGIGFLIHLYSTSYMAHDAGFARYFAYLNLFVAMMLTLVLADNLVLLFVGWEGVGLCSYLLIGFWYTDPAKAWAGRKAFITNRVGDCAFVIGAILLVLWVGAAAKQLPADQGGERLRSGIASTGPLSFSALEAVAKNVALDSTIAAPSAPDQGGRWLEGRTYGGVLTAILLLLMLGAAGKSAQIPLYVWLPDAMAGPTPVSALIHAATMVTSGIYLFCRLSALLVLSPVAMATVALVGACTSVLAALIAFSQNDIKKVLAYSTVSQLGIMFMGVGFGVFWAAIFHLVTHACFKACLFLGAGSVMHGNADETDIQKLGGLRREMPWTWGTFTVATLAITGVVPLSGFFSKDAILHGIHSTELRSMPWVGHLVWGLGLLAAAGTAFYMTRLYFLVFEGRRSSQARIPHAHESDSAMTIPLLVLATLSVATLTYGLPLILGPEGRQAVFENYLFPIFASASALRGTLGQVEVHEGGGMFGAYLLAWAIALAGAGLAAFLYGKQKPSAGRLPSWLQGPRRWAEDKFYVDEVYERLVIRPIKAASSLFSKLVDGLLIEGLLVRGTSFIVVQSGTVLRYFQTGDAQNYAAVMVLALLGGLAYALFVLR